MDAASPANMENGPPFGPATAQAPRLDRLRACRRRGFLHALWGTAILVSLAAVFFVRLAELGLPETWVDELSRRLTTDLYSVELSGVSFSLADMELHVSEARVHPKGSVQKPLARAAGVCIGLRPRRTAPWTEWIREIRLQSLAVSLPEGDMPSGGDDRSFAVADFPPIAFSCRSSDIMGLHLRHTSGTLSCRGGRLSVADARTDLHEPRESRQRMEGAFECDPARLSFKSSGRGRFDPAKLDALLRAVGAPDVADEIAKFSFAGHPPEADAVYEYDPAAGVRSLDVAIRADGGGVFNGVPFSEAEARLHVSGPSGWSRLDVRDLRVRRPEGKARGELSIDLDGRTIRFDATSTLDPKRTLSMVGALPDVDQLPVDFDNPTKVVASGLIALGRGDSSRTSIRLQIESTGVSAPDLPGLRFDRVRAEGVFTNSVLDLTDIRADALDGDADLALRLSLPAVGRDETELRIGGSVRGVSHASWASLFGETLEGDAGSVDADFLLDGPVSDLVSLQPVRTTGAIDMTVRNVPVFRILFFSGLREFLSRRLSSFDPFAEDYLHVEMKMADGVIAVEKLRIEGGALSITGSGNIWTDGVVNLGVKVHLMNRRTWIGAGLYYLFSPISSLLAVRATGPSDNPRWDSEALFISGTDVKPAVAPKPQPARSATP